jgi:hypothetical protein
MMPTYAVVALPVLLVSKHVQSGPTFAAYRMINPPCALVGLEEDKAHSSFFVTVLAAKGLVADAVDRDWEFWAAVIRAVERP